MIEQTTFCERHLDAVRTAYAAGCRNFMEVSFKPQPITWLNEQLVDKNGTPLPGVTARALKTEELA